MNTKRVLYDTQTGEIFGSTTRGRRRIGKVDKVDVEVDIPTKTTVARDHAIFRFQRAIHVRIANDESTKNTALIHDRKTVGNNGERTGKDGS